MAGRLLAVYSRGGAEEDAGGEEGGEEGGVRRGEEKDGRKLRNLTTPTQSGGEKHFKVVKQLFKIINKTFQNH